jgi:hypothetical protein
MFLDMMIFLTLKMLLIIYQVSTLQEGKKFIYMINK